MDDQSRNLILATALSFLVLLGWFVLGPILFPNAFPPPRGDRAGHPGRRRDATTPRRRPPPGAAPAPEAAHGRRARRPARRCWRRARGCRSRPPASRARSRSSAAASTTSRSATTPSRSSPARPTVTLLQPPGRRARLLRPLRLDALGAARPPTRARPRHGLDRRERQGADRDHAGHAALGQRPGPRLPPDLRHRRELHVHRHPVGRERDRRRRSSSAPTASSSARGCRPT